MYQIIYYVGYAMFAFGMTMLGIGSFLSYKDERFEIMVLISLIFLMVGFFFILTSKQEDSEAISSYKDELEMFRDVD